ncbi:MAG: hypothetical protein NTZ89_00240 [Actinobacteria bacterium]|nr:hypothetical protein [Actinomycetota bacterium]
MQQWKGISDTLQKNPKPKKLLADEQLSEADITIKEVNIVKNTLIDGLMSIYHSRISYQDAKIISAEV